MKPGLSNTPEISDGSEPMSFTWKEGFRELAVAASSRRHGEMLQVGWWSFPRGTGELVKAFFVPRRAASHMLHQDPAEFHCAVSEAIRIEKRGCLLHSGRSKRQSRLRRRVLSRLVLITTRGYYKTLEIDALISLNKHVNCLDWPVLCFPAELLAASTVHQVCGN